LDTAETELKLMTEAKERAKSNRHVLGDWESFSAGAVRIASCTACKRHAWAEVFPNGDDDKGNQVYKTDIRGSAVTMECGGRKVN
jgi:hypothetical protein